MKFELCNCTNYLLEEIANKQFKQKDIALTYAMALAQKTETVDWKKVNLAIINRWSKSGLIRIKEMAWKRLEGG